MDRKMLVGVTSSLYLASNMSRPIKVTNHYKNSALFIAHIENLIFNNLATRILNNKNIQFIVSGMSN